MEADHEDEGGPSAMDTDRPHLDRNEVENEDERIHVDVTELPTVLPMIDVAGINGRLTHPLIWRDILDELKSLGITAEAPAADLLGEHVPSTHLFDYLVAAVSIASSDESTTMPHIMKEKVIEWLQNHIFDPDVVPPTQYTDRSSSIYDSIIRRQEAFEAPEREQVAGNLRPTATSPHPPETWSEPVLQYMKILEVQRTWTDELMLCATAHALNARFCLHLVGAMAKPIFIGPAEHSLEISFVLCRGCIFAKVVHIVTGDNEMPLEVLATGQDDDEDYGKLGEDVSSKTANVAASSSGASDDHNETNLASMNRSGTWVNCDNCECWRYIYPPTKLSKTAPWKCGGVGTVSSFEKSCFDPPIYQIISSFCGHYGDLSWHDQFRALLKSHRRVVLDLARLFLDVYALGGIETVVRLGKVKDIAITQGLPLQTSTGGSLHQKYKDVFQVRKIWRDARDYADWLNASPDDRHSDKFLGIDDHSSLPRSSSLEHFIIDRLDYLVNLKHSKFRPNLHRDSILQHYKVTQKDVLDLSENAVLRGISHGAGVVEADANLPLRSAQLGFSEDIQLRLRHHREILLNDERNLKLDGAVRQHLSDLLQLLSEDNSAAATLGQPRQTLVMLGDTGSGKSFLIDTLLRISARNPLSYIERLKSILSATGDTLSPATRIEDILEGKLDDPNANVIVVPLINRTEFPPVNLQQKALQALQHGKGNNAPFILPSFAGACSTTSISTAIRGATVFHLLVSYKEIPTLAREWFEARNAKNTQPTGFRAAVQQIKDMCTLSDYDDAESLLDEAEDVDDIVDAVLRHNKNDDLLACSGSQIFVGDGDDPQKHRLLIAELLRRIHGVETDSVETDPPLSGAHPLLQTSKVAYSFGKRTSPLIYRIIVYADCAFAPSREVELVDSPGTNDNNIVRDWRLQEDLRLALQVVCVSSRGLSVGKSALDALKRWDEWDAVAERLRPLPLKAERDILQNLPLSKLVVVINWEPELRGELERNASSTGNAVRQVSQRPQTLFTTLVQLQKYKDTMESLKDSTATTIQEALRQCPPTTPTANADRSSVDGKGLSKANITGYIPIVPVALIDGANVILDSDCKADESMIESTGLAAVLGHFELLLGLSSHNLQQQVILEATKLNSFLKESPEDTGRLSDADVKMDLDELRKLFDRFSVEFLAEVAGRVRASQASRIVDDRGDPKNEDHDRERTGRRTRAAASTTTKLSKRLEKALLVANTGAPGAHNTGSGSPQLHPSLHNLWINRFLDPAKHLIATRLSDTEQTSLHLLFQKVDKDFSELINAAWFQQIVSVNRLHVTDINQAADILQSSVRARLDNLCVSLFGPGDAQRKTKRFPKFYSSITSIASQRDQKSVGTLMRHVSALLHDLNRIQLNDELSHIARGQSSVVQLGLRLAEKYRRLRWAEDAARSGNVVDALDFDNANTPTDAISNDSPPSKVDTNESNDLGNRFLQMRMNDGNLFLLKSVLSKRGLVLSQPHNAKRGEMNLFATYLRILGLEGSLQQQIQLRAQLKHCVKATAETRTGIPTTVMNALIQKLQEVEYFKHPMWCLLYLSVVLLKRPLHLYVSWQDVPYRFDNGSQAQEAADAIAFLGCNSYGVPLFDRCVPPEAIPKEDPESLDADENNGDAVANLLLNQSPTDVSDGSASLAMTLDEHGAESALTVHTTDSAGDRKDSSGQRIKRGYISRDDQNDRRGLPPASRARRTDYASVASGVHNSGIETSVGVIEPSNRASPPAGTNVLSEASESTDSSAVSASAAPTESASADSARSKSFHPREQYPFATFDRDNWKEIKLNTGVYRNRSLIRSQYDVKLVASDLNILATNFWQLTSCFMHTHAKSGDELDNNDSYYASKGVAAVFDGVSSSTHAKRFVDSMIRGLHYNFGALAHCEVPMDHLTTADSGGHGPRALNVSKYRLQKAEKRAQSDRLKFSKEKQLSSENIHGTSTVAMVSLVRVTELTGAAKSSDMALHGSSIGDARWMVLRQSSRDKLTDNIVFEFVAGSTFPENCFVDDYKRADMPRQFGWVRGDTPNWSQDHTFREVQLGDVVLLGTDGFFDNLVLARDKTTEAVVKRLNQLAKAHVAATGSSSLSPQWLHNLGRFLFDTVWNQSISQNTYAKPDDITLVISIVSVIPSFPSRQGV